MRKLLIVTPHFAPVNAPDMQRVRMSLPHFVSAGWEITVLTVADPTPIAPIDPDLESMVPAGVHVARVKCLSRRWTRWLGVNNVVWRSLPFLFLGGYRLIKTRRPDVIYFSTTQFLALPLGRLWKFLNGVPYVIDLQDPWVNDYYERTGIAPPGGWKYRVVSTLARMLEGWTLRGAAHVISVSPRYLDDLNKRYPWWQAERGSVLTFGAPNDDFERLHDVSATRATMLPVVPGLRIAYAGRLGPDIRPALNVLFAAVAKWKDAPRRIELFFFGTSYAPPGRAESFATERALQYGIGDLVHEWPARIGYLDSLRLLLETDVALLLGSEDAAYSPSKIYPTLLAARPTIALAPAGSVLEQKIRELGGAALVPFPPMDAAIAAVADLLGQCLQSISPSLGAPLNRDLFEEHYSASAVARRQLEILSSAAFDGNHLTPRRGHRRRP